MRTASALREFLEDVQQGFKSLLPQMRNGLLADLSGAGGILRKDGTAGPW